MASLDDELAALATMSPAQLRGKWLQTFKSAAPDVGHRLLALAIAHRLQARTNGDLSSRHARELDRLASKYARTGELDLDSAASLKVGTRLVREWQGITHQVEIVDSGYIYRDRQYRSLSQVARAISGSNWSGPRFFGLRRAGKGAADG